MGNFVLRTSRGVSGNITPNYRKYTRPEEWIDLPTLVDGDEVIHMLVKVYEQGSNYLAVDVDGDYQVDWGDGNTTTHTSGTQANWDIQWSGVSPTTTSYGYRQAIVSITPQSGSSITRIQMRGDTVVHPDDPFGYNLNVVDIKMAGQNFITLQQAFYRCYGLEQFEYVGSAPSLTSTYDMFNSCSNLRKVVQFDTSNVTSFGYMHRYCYRLLEVPKYDLSSTTNVTYMFGDCSNIEYIQPWDLDNDAPSLTSIQSMFRGCTRLKNLPITSCNNIQNFYDTFNSTNIKKFDLPIPSTNSVASMFAGCAGLEEFNSQVPSGITRTDYMFDQCSSLKTVQPFDTTQVTNSGFMFRNTYELKDVSSFNFSASTIQQYMFINSGIENPPQQMGGGNLTYFSQSASYVREWSTFNQPITTLFRAFYSNISLEVVPDMDISSVTDIRSSFTNCWQLQSLPAWNLSGVTNSDSTTFQACYSLRESNISGLTRTHGYRYCQLDRDAIVNIFNNLGVASSQTIYVNNNPGSANLTAGDIAIATGKGWTVVS